MEGALETRRGNPLTMEVKKVGRREDTGQTEMPQVGTEPALGLRSSPGWVFLDSLPYLGLEDPAVWAESRVHPLGKNGDKHTKKESGLSGP